MALLAALAPFRSKSGDARVTRKAPLPAPYRWMKELALGERDRRFADDFPGFVHRVTDGQREYIVRRIDQPTRKLHPAEHCFRGAGYRVEPAAVERDGGGYSSCFTASKGERLKVCQQIFNDRGEQWSDVSSWYWHAVFGRSRGPWWAVTQISRE